MSTFSPGLGTVNACGATMTSLCKEVPPTIDAIVSEWERRMQRPPWTSLSRSDRVDHLPPLLSAMIEGVVCGKGSHEARRRVVEQGIIHGTQRQTIGFSVENILDEESQLRAAMWKLLIGETGDDIDAGAFLEIIRFDVAIGVSTVASVTGFNRSAAKKDYDRSGVVDLLLAQWEHATLMVAMDQLAG